MVDSIDDDKLKQIIEAALMAADEPLTVDRLSRLFGPGELDDEGGRAQLRNALEVLQQEAQGRGYELQRVASGYRYQVRQALSPWVSRLWEEKPPRYTRALLETLALIAYRQPVTRGDIEQVRGVAVSPNIMRTLLERGWIRVVGQREVPGKPNLYGTTRTFLDYFNLKSLDQLPPLAEIRALVEPLVVEELADADASAEHQGATTATEHEEVPGDAGSEESDEPALPRVRVEEVTLEPDAESGAPGTEQDGAGAAVEADQEAPGDGRTGAPDPDRLSGAEAEVDGEQAGPDPDDTEGQELPSADVVRLPTAPRR